MISIIVCSINPKRLSALKQNISRTIGSDVTYEVLSIDNRQSPRSLAEVYNALASESRFDNLLFIHEDVAFETDDWYSLVSGCLGRPDTGMIGFAGAKVMADAPSGWAHSARYNVMKLTEKGDKIDCNLDMGKDFIEVVTLDGLAMFMRKEVWKKYPFDEKLLTGFHCYDIDESLSVGQEYRNYVCNCVNVRHDSSGSFNSAWLETTLKCYSEKWRYMLPRTAGDFPVSAEELAKEKEQQYYRMLKRLRKEGMKDKEMERVFDTLPNSVRHLEHKIKLLTKYRKRKGKACVEKKETDAGGSFLTYLFGIIGSLPLRVLYGVSDIAAFIMHRVVAYRRKVIRKNLSASFPEKTEKELREIEKNFYHFLTDYFVETLRLGRMSDAEISRRMIFENDEELFRYAAEGRSVTVYLGHYCNWEWVSSLPLHVKNRVHFGQIYHPLENKGADKAFLKIRGRFGAESIKMADTLPTLMKWRREGVPSIIGYIADQVPLFESMHYFADFLNQDTPAFTGPERLSRMLDTVVYYADMSRPERGKYVCRFVKITDCVKDVPKFELTQRYYDLLEASIRRQPAFWLWSHNRWKRTKQQFFEIFGEEDGKKRLSHL